MKGNKSIMDNRNNSFNTQNDDANFRLTDFAQSNEASSERKSTQTVKPARKTIRKGSGVTSTYIFFIVVIAVSMVISIYALLCMNDILAITKSKSTVTVTMNTQIEEAADAIDLLSDNGLIKCKNFCKLFAKIRNDEIGGPYSAGVYYLNAKQGLEGMLITLQGDVTATTETVKITFPEGYTTPEIIEKLVDNEVCDKSSLISTIQSTEFSYSLVTNLKANEHVPYRLEGYLYPDTYDFYIGESASSVIKKFLSNGDEKFTQKYRERAKELGYSTQEIIIIASIIQKEAANSAQMKDISSVIHNRLNDKINYPSLGCMSTADYITNFVADSLSSTSAHTPGYYKDFYDTSTASTVVGLPEGAICNPGIDAIEAALYPNDTNYYYFFHDTDGNLYCQKNYTQNRQEIQKYAPYLNY